MLHNDVSALKKNVNINKIYYNFRDSPKMKRELVMIKAEQTESRTPLRLGTSWDSFMRMFDVMPRR